MLGKRKKNLATFCIVLFVVFVGTEIPAQDANLQAVGALARQISI